MISIIVPVYKSERTLGSCIESLLAQTYKEIEIICVVDGSPDRCGELCDEYAKKDNRVRVIKRENGGVSSARNRGIDEAAGEYLMFVDSDDTVEPDYCQKMFEEMQHSGTELVICGFHHWYVGRDVEKKPKKKCVYETADYAEDFLKLYQEGYLNMPWNKLFLKKTAGSFDTSLSLGEDLLFNMDYLEKCTRISVIPEALYHYIQEEKGNTLSSKKRDDKLEIAVKVCRRVQEYYRRMTGERELHPVIAGKFVMEFLDDCEKLPFDSELSGKKKRQMIRSLAENKEFLQANERAEVIMPDYRILQWCFRKKLLWPIYPFCVLRKKIVILVRWIWNR